MPTYTTKYVMNLTTGEPFTFEVPEKVFERLNLQRGLIESGQAPTLGSVQELTTNYEFSFFPSFEKVRGIFFRNEYTNELAIEILTDFGLTAEFAERVVSDEGFVSSAKPWFEGITCDGSRASRTMNRVYDLAKSYFSTKIRGESFEEFSERFNREFDKFFDGNQ